MDSPLNLLLLLFMFRILFSVLIKEENLIQTPVLITPGLKHKQQSHWQPRKQHRLLPSHHCSREPHTVWGGQHEHQGWATDLCVQTVEGLRWCMKVTLMEKYSHTAQCLFISLLLNATAGINHMHQQASQLTRTTETEQWVNSLKMITQSWHTHTHTAARFCWVCALASSFLDESVKSAEWNTGRGEESFRAQMHIDYLDTAG